jgi:hypothetical protein
MVLAKYVSDNAVGEAEVATFTDSKTGVVPGGYFRALPSSRWRTLEFLPPIRKLVGAASKNLAGLRDAVRATWRMTHNVLTHDKQEPLGPPTVRIGSCWDIGQCLCKGRGRYVKKFCKNYNERIKPQCMAKNVQHLFSLGLGFKATCT